MHASSTCYGPGQVLITYAIQRVQMHNQQFLIIAERQTLAFKYSDFYTHYVEVTTGEYSFSSEIVAVVGLGGLG